MGYSARGTIAVCALYLIGMTNPVVAQDVPGIELCTHESRLDRRTSCLQSNVEFLQQVISKNALDARQKLNDANRDIAALKESLAAANRDIAALKENAARAQARIEKLEASSSKTEPVAKGDKNADRVLPGR